MLKPSIRIGWTDSKGCEHLQGGGTQGTWGPPEKMRVWLEDADLDSRKFVELVPKHSIRNNRWTDLKVRPEPEMPT